MGGRVEGESDVVHDGTDISPRGDSHAKGEDGRRVGVQIVSSRQCRRRGRGGGSIDRGGVGRSRFNRTLVLRVSLSDQPLCRIRQCLLFLGHLLLWPFEVMSFTSSSLFLTRTSRLLALLPTLQDELMDRHFPGLDRPREFLSVPGVFIECLAIHLESRVDRWELKDLAPESIEDGLNVSRCQVGIRCGGDDGSSGIKRIGRTAQECRCSVLLASKVGIGDISES